MSTSSFQNAASETRKATEEFEVASALKAAARKAAGKQEMYREAMRILARHFDSPYCAIGIETSAGCFEDAIRASESADRWKSLCGGLLLDTRYRKIGVAKLYTSGSLETSFAALATPIREESHGVVGSIVIVVATVDKASASAQLAELRALVAMLGLLADTFESVRSDPAPRDTSGGVASVAGHGSLQEFAFALANGLKTKLGCEQVSLGLVRGTRMRVACISGLDDLYPRSPGVRLIRQAMEECLDVGETICYQTKALADASSTRGHLLHRRWHNQTGNSAVASIPLRVDGRCVAVLSIRKSADASFKGSELEKITQVVTQLASGLVLLQKADRGLPRHAFEAMIASTKRWLAPSAWGRRTAVVVAMLAASWVTFGKTSFVVTVPCEVVSHAAWQVSAPFDGKLLEASAKQGDRVAAGQRILLFDTREMSLERDRLRSERRIAELELAQALKQGEQTMAARAAARIEMADASLRLVEDRISRSDVRAPSAGTILSGDLSGRIGEVMQVGEPLLEFAPHGSWSLELHVPQYASTFIRSGQVGRFTTTARPDLSHTCDVVRMPVASSILNDRQVFVAESSIADAPAWVRSGMTGVAKIDAGQHPVWWVGVHRVINSIRLYLWQI